MRKLIIVFFAVGFFCCFSGVYSFADENSVPAANTVPAGNQGVSEKLDRILNTQAEILRKLEEVRAEVEITKIRASQR